MIGRGFSPVSSTWWHSRQALQRSSQWAEVAKQARDDTFCPLCCIQQCKGAANPSVSWFGNHPTLTLTAVILALHHELITHPRYNNGWRSPPMFAWGFMGEHLETRHDNYQTLPFYLPEKEQKGIQPSFPFSLEMWIFSHFYCHFSN